MFGSIKIWQPCPKHVLPKPATETCPRDGEQHIKELDFCTGGSLSWF
jgi:hypothetical protein